MSLWHQVISWGWISRILYFIAIISYYVFHVSSRAAFDTTIFSVTPIIPFNLQMSCFCFKVTFYQFHYSYRIINNSLPRCLLQTRAFFCFFVAEVLSIQPFFIYSSLLSAMTDGDDSELANVVCNARACTCKCTNTSGTVHVMLCIYRQLLWVLWKYLIHPCDAP